jgi:hypothetical protein
VQVVWGLGNIAGDSALHRDVVVRAGAVPALARALELTGHREVSQAMALNVAWTLCNLCRGKPSAPLQVVQQALGMFSALVFHQVGMGVRCRVGGGGKGWERMVCMLVCGGGGGGRG